VIAVIGASGQVGRLVVAALEEPAVLVTRQPDALQTELACARPGVEHRVAGADLADPASIEAALAGCDTLICIPADGPDQVRHETGAYASAKRAGVERVVKLSAQSAGLSPPVSFGRQHAQTEAVLAAEGVDAVVVRPVFFAQNLLAMAPTIRKGRLIYPAGRGAVAFVDARDVAAVLAAAALDRRISGTLTLTGPEPLTFQEVANLLGAVTGRRVRHLSPPAAIARRVLPKMAGLPPPIAQLVVELAQAQKAGLQASVSGDVEAVLGRPAGSVRSFVADHADRFR
jgi:uncharacterized protein YbjT (DUF2867 family)